MSLGSMRERVTINRKGKVRRPDGGEDEVDSQIASFFAEVKPVAAREGEAAGRMYGSTTFVITTHARNLPRDLSTADTVQWSTGGGAKFNIRGIRRAGDSQLLAEIVAEQGAVL